ncbi:hypothetical protein JCGZ_15345 [Jatropha curcas]|uniref:Uncharacterized protein n=1 Tax=Jatropha curcas TaxID=180498 RepID=A0A067KGS3_JATCU|nr:hypothetical protein JCGZ_15345 [Jatropha curcas]
MAHQSPSKKAPSQGQPSKVEHSQTKTANWLKSTAKAVNNHHDATRPPYKCRNGTVSPPRQVFKALQRRHTSKGQPLKGAFQNQTVQNGAPGRPKCHIHSSAEVVPSGVS